MVLPAKVVSSKPLHHNASRVPGVFELHAYVLGQGPQLEDATEAFELLCKDFHAKLEALGVEVIASKAELRALYAEEALNILPRKMHYAPNDVRVCTTEHVAKRNLTSDREKVTCRLCLKVMGVQK